MKNSTLIGRSKSLKVSVNVANSVRNGQTFLIKPLIAKQELKLNQYYYFKEYDENLKSYTTKETAHTYIRVISNKIVSVQNITEDDYRCLGVDNAKDFVNYYNSLINDMAEELSSKTAKNKLIHNYSYICNPCVELVEFEIIDPTTLN